MEGNKVFFIRLSFLLLAKDVRSQFRSLSHLPLTCEFQVIEIRFHPPVVSPATMQVFQGQFIDFLDECVGHPSVRFLEEIHRRRQLRTRKERLEKRRQEQAELAESQKLFSQCKLSSTVISSSLIDSISFVDPPEMMYIPQQSFPVNGTASMEEFPAIISSIASSSSPPSATVQQLSDENLSPPVAPTTPSVSFAQMLKQQAPPVWVTKPVSTAKPVINKSLSVDVSSSKTKKKSKNKNNNDTDDDVLNEDEEYYSSVPNFHSSFSLEGVFDRLKLGLSLIHSSRTRRKCCSVQ